MARLDDVQARSAGVVRVGESDVGAQGGGDHVAVTDEPARSAGVDPVGDPAGE
ncbi:hypothetical protein [Streptomyces brasiliensis]|uniref:hypothetical protein n=1 Tax=Streptomyces brasiliensis TaxID=1954 RepID=UPI0016701101|nr:hypothetical protein [Streptomyces brasiliensis]